MKVRMMLFVDGFKPACIDLDDIESIKDLNDDDHKVRLLDKWNEINDTPPVLIKNGTGVCINMDTGKCLASNSSIAFANAPDDPELLADITMMMADKGPVKII